MKQKVGAEIPPTRGCAARWRSIFSEFAVLTNKNWRNKGLPRLSFLA